MKLSPISLILLCCLSLFPVRLPEAAVAEPVMTGANYTIRGTFASVLGDVENDRMCSYRVYAPRGQY